MYKPYFQIKPCNHHYMQAFYSVIEFVPSSQDMIRTKDGNINNFILNGNKTNWKLCS